MCKQNTVTIILLLLTSFSWGQSPLSTQTALLNCLENYYDTNDLLVNGRKYVPKSTKIKGHVFYTNNEYRVGKVFSKGQSFSPVFLKYDLLHDELILRQELKQGSLVEVVLNKENIDSFHIAHSLLNNHFERFINTKSSNNTYLKIIYEGKSSLFKQFKKVFYPRFSDKTPAGMFEEEKSSLVVFKNGRFYKLKNKRAFLSFFTTRKSEIKKFLRQYNIKFKKASDRQLQKLMAYIDSL